MARGPQDPKTRGVMEVDWPFFGELCRGLALKVWRDYEPDLVVGIANAGVIPGAVIAAILRVDFASVALTRRREGEAPALVSRPTLSPRGHRVLLVDETCDSGDTMRLAASVMREEGAKEVRTAVSFRTASFHPDYWALQTPDFIILPWDRWIIQDGELIVRPDYADALGAAGLPGEVAHQRSGPASDAERAGHAPAVAPGRAHPAKAPASKAPRTPKAPKRKVTRPKAPKR
jgi:hypoxanthine phosphoribosyltransferase